ncbi:MAG TPA: AAA family ATPase [Gammaproteobacteria bacterium]|nr:AAA family ATPase [Gammaproteobacteria bacterium]
MYPAHFGLKKALFDSGIAQGASVFLGPKQQLVVANAKVALTTLDSVLVLTGPAGVGKTTVASAALRESSTRLALGWLGGTPANASELLDLLLVEFGLEPPRAGRMERLQLWRQFLNETNATDSRVFVIVERADDMGAALLRSLESFTRADANGCTGANVVLLGEQALLEQLKLPALDSLRQRIRLRQKLEPFRADELRAYLDHEVTVAGGVLDKIFAAGAIAAIHRYTGGVPRLVNNLCETALTLAATRGERQITAESVANVATGLLGLDEPASAEQPAEAVRRSSSAPTAAPAPATQSQNPAQPTTPPEPSGVQSAATQPATVQSAAAQPATVQPAAAQPAMAQPAAEQSAAVQPAAQPAPALPAPQPSAAAPAAPPSRPLPSIIAPPAPANRPAMPPAARAAAAQPAPAAAAPSKPAPPPTLAEPEFFEGDSTDIVAQELLTATIVDETPDVQMPEFPVLTDAVDTPAPYSRSPKVEPAALTAKPAAPPPSVKIRRPIASSPPPKFTATPALPAKAAAPAEKPAPAPRPAPSKPAAASAPAEAEDHDTKTMRALAAAKSIDDISNSMAETLFGEADLDMFSSALAAGSWPESDDAAAPAPAKAAKKADDSDGFDLFDLGPDAPLELIDDSSLPPQIGGRKLVSNR